MAGRATPRARHRCACSSTRRHPMRCPRTQSLKARRLWRRGFGRCFSRACGLVCQCRIFARPRPKTNDSVQVAGLGCAPLATPLRSRHVGLCSRRGMLAATGYVGAGLSPGDAYYDEPYFYVSVYPQPDRAGAAAPAEARPLHTHEFTAAVVPAHQIVAANNPKTAADEFSRPRSTSRSNS